MKIYLFSAVLGIWLLLTTQGAAFQSDQLSIQVKGNGPDIMLIHGFACSPEIWSGIVEKLHSRFRLHVVRMAGFAGTPAPEPIPSSCLDTLRDELLRYIREEKLNRPVLIGHSMGGLAVMMMAGKETSLMSKVVVIDALPFFSLNFNPQANSEQMKPQAKVIQKYMSTMSDVLIKVQASSVIGTFTKGQDKKDLLLKWSMDSDRKIYAQYLAELIAYDARPELKAINCPLTVLYAFDQTMPISEASLKERYVSAYSGLKGTQLSQINDSLHCIMWDQPEALLKALEDVLSQPIAN